MLLLLDYKIFIYFKIKYSDKWKKLSDLNRYDIIFINNDKIHSRVYCNFVFKSIDFKGEISIYQYKEIEIIIPKNKKLYKSKILDSFLLYYNNIEYKTTLYLVASLYKENYLLIPERIAIKLQKRPNCNFIYKNGKYIVKDKIIPNKMSNYLDNGFWSFKYICELIYLNGSNKFYGKKEKINLLKTLCKINGIEYEICKNCIEIFIINQQELIYKEDKYFEGKMYSYHDDISLYIKIGKYIILI